MSKGSDLRILIIYMETIGLPILGAIGILYGLIEIIRGFIEKNMVYTSDGAVTMVLGVIFGAIYLYRRRRFYKRLEQKQPTRT